MGDASDSARAARGLADRLRNVLLALDRRDRLETADAFVGWLEGERRGDRLATSAAELLLRAWRVASDPTSFELLRRLDPVEAVTVAELMRASGLSRVALSERLHDMAQTGLASLEMLGDQVRGTELAIAFVAWVEEVAARAAERVERELGGRDRSAEESRGGG